MSFDPKTIVENFVASIPADERPDITELVQTTVDAFNNPGITEWKGCRFPSPFNAKKVEWQYNNWDPSENNVLIVSYPKTGTTWATQIVRNIIFRDDPEILEALKHALPQVAYIEGGTPVSFEIMEKIAPKRPIYATHLPANMLNLEKLKEKNCKMIYMIRNPKDQLVSWFNMSNNLPYHKTECMREHFSTDWNKFFDTLITGKQPLFTKEGEWYPHHILSWYTHCNDDNIMFVMFEDLKQNPCKEIRRIADFLGVKRSDEEIVEINKDTSFGTMKKEATPFMNEVKMFRRGKVTDWKNHFTVAQSELMDEKMDEMLSHTDIKFTYEI